MGLFEEYKKMTLRKGVNKQGHKFVKVSSFH